MNPASDEPASFITAAVPSVGAPQAGALARRLVSGATLYALTNFGIKTMSFLLLPLFTRFLTPGEYGAINLSETVAAMTAIVSGLGLNAGVSRFYFHYVEQREELRRYLSSMFFSALAISALVLLTGFLLLPPALHRFAPGFAVPFFPLVALAMATAVAAQLSDLRLTIYQLEERPRAYGSLALLLFLLTAGCSIVFVVEMRGGARGMLLGKFLAAAAGLLVSSFLLRSWLVACWRSSYLRETLALALPVVPHQFMAFGLIAADRLILSHYRPLDEVGIYTLAYTFGMVMSLVTNSLSQAWFPMFYDLARREEAARPLLGRLATSLLVFLTAVACIGALISADVPRLMLDARYHAVGPLIPWIIGGYLFHGLFSLFHLTVFQKRRSALLLPASITACFANIALNLWWIPMWGMLGAAIATFAGYLLEALVMYVIAQRVFPVPLGRARVLAAFGIFALVLASTQMFWTGMLHWTVLTAGLLLCAAMLWSVRWLKWPEHSG